MMKSVSKVVALLAVASMLTGCAMLCRHCCPKSAACGGAETASAPAGCCPSAAL